MQFFKFLRTMMTKMRSNQWQLHTLVCVLILLKIESKSVVVPITIIEGAVAKGAVCLDGSPPAYQFDAGFGDGRNNWLVHIQGGGWCNSVDDCRTRTYGPLGSSKKMKSSDYYFTGILSSNQESNPNFYNWNRIAIRYCDGSSFTGDIEAVDPVTNLHFRGARVFNVIMEELLGKLGMKSASNALLSGSSAGGLASILHCDKFRKFFPTSTRVKCFSDAGYFAHVKDLSKDYRFERYYDQIITLHGSSKNLYPECLSKKKANLCFYPQYVMPYVKTPVFILQSTYDTFQIQNILASPGADPNGLFTTCKQDINACSTDQIQTLQDFRSDFLKALSVVGNDPSRGWFVNNCFTHGQCEFPTTWFGNPSSKLNHMAIAEAVGEWFYDRSTVQLIDDENVLPHYCIN